MARKKSEFLSAFGTAFEIWKAIVEAVFARGGTDDDLRRIISDCDLAGKIADLIVAKVVEPAAPADFIAPISDKDLAEELRELAAKWRRLAAELGYAGPIAWKVRAGFTLKQHAPKVGPCYENFGYLQGWNLRNDEPTKDGIVFWIPRLLPNSTAKTVDEQMTLLADLRRKYDLPASHLVSFGSAALLTGLILAHFKITGERVPLDRYWVRTDTLSAGGGRLSLGGFDVGGLGCGHDGWGAGRFGFLGCFALGV